MVIKALQQRHKQRKIEQRQRSMKTNHKIIMLSVAAMMGISPIVGISSLHAGEVVYASTYRTVGSNRVKVIKDTCFVNSKGKALNLKS